MTLSVPPRSSPPPVPPPKVAAEARVKALRADLEQITASAQRAAVLYEIGALTETRLSDRAAAIGCYLEALQSEPNFRPPLFALARLSREADDYPQLARVLEALAKVSSVPSEAASVLVELGGVLADHLDDPHTARARFEEALARDPSSHVAALMLERHERGAGNSERAQAALAQRAAHTRDPLLSARLRAEVAEEVLAQGHFDQAIELLLTAAAAPAQRYAMLERVAAIARAHARHATAAQAFDDMAGLLEQRLSDDPSAGMRELRARFPDAAACQASIAALRRNAGRLHLAYTDNLDAARRAYETAAQYAPGDVLVRLEHTLVCELSGDIEAAKAQVTALLPQSDPKRAAALSFYLAELAEQQGDRAQARADLQAALITDPDSPAVLAVLEDALIDERAFAQLCDHLEARAQLADDSERRTLSMRAAAIANGPGHDEARALRLYGALLPGASNRTALLREQYGAALRARDTSALLSVTDALLEAGVDEIEACALLRRRYETLLGARESEKAQAALVEALASTVCDAWAPHCATVMGALRSDYGLLARAHARLAELATDAEQRVAHLCAQGRALSRLGAGEEAIAVLQRALGVSPGNAYAVALLEELLHAAGHATDAIHLLREAAAAESSARRGELALLHAGALAESAGRLDLAARSYEEAHEREPNAIAPLWALRRAAERANDRDLELSAIEGLALRETRLSQAGSANVELGERYDLRDAAELAEAPLRAAMGGSAAFEANVAAWLLPSTGPHDTLRSDALDWLQEHVSEDSRAWLLREQCVLHVHDAPERARETLFALSRTHETNTSDGLWRWLIATTPRERADALQSFAEHCDDGNARADLLLHAARVRALAGISTEAEALSSALLAIHEAPEALSSAVALGEALAPSDDAEMRVRALEVRLAHTLPEASQSLSGALARALLEADRPADATTLSLSLVHKDSSDLSAWETLRMAARAAGDLENVVLACDKLALGAEGEARALLLEESAALLEEELSRPAEAEQRLYAALEADESRLSLFERLHDLLLERHDFDALVALVSARVRVAASEAERSDLLYEQARLLRGLGEREAALACIAEVLGVEPSHAGALGLSVEIHASTQDWLAAIDALQALARADAPEQQRKLARQGAADFFARHMQDPKSAYGELEILAQEGLADLGTYRRMADLAQRAQLWPQAIDALLQAARRGSGTERAGFERRAGEILARDPATRDQAHKAFARALVALPSDIEACEALCGLVDEAQRSALLTTFTTHVLGTLSKEPERVVELRGLRRAAQLSHDGTLEQIALSALRALGLSSMEEMADEQRIEASIATTPSDSFSDEHFVALWDASTPPAAWQFARIASSVWLDANADVPKQYGVDRHDRVGRRADHPVRDALHAWTESFGLEVSELYVGGSDAQAIRMLRQAGRAQAWVVGKNVGTPLGKHARFRVAEQCAAVRIGVLPLLHGDKASAYDILLAMRAAVTSTPADTEARQKLAARLARAMSRAQKRELEQCLAQLGQSPTEALDAVIDASRMLCMRAGMLAAGDPSIAIERTLGPSFDTALVTGSAQALSLLRFWTSNTLVALRRELGLCA